MSSTACVRLVEVGPRDGLQSEKRPVPTEAKVAFVDALSASGLPEIEVSSFVSPAWVPQLADAEAVFERISRREGVVYMALVPNRKGLERALACSVDKLAVFTAASETFNRRNVNASIAESVERFRRVIEGAGGLPVRGYVSTAFHCPYEGRVAPEAVVDVMKMLLDLGCVEISIGDTIGRATPDDVAAVVEACLGACPAERIAMHFHDTYGHAVENALRAHALGIRTFDASTGGIGGCPYAPGASGNVATDALVAAFPGETGVDPVALSAAAALVRPHLGPRRPPMAEPL